MSSVFQIIKNRWTEVLLVVVLQAGIFMLAMQVFGENPLSEETTKQMETIPAGKSFVLSFGTTALWVLWQMLYLGFLATVYTGKDRPQQPAQLLIAGRYFFWRMFRFQLLLGVAIFALMAVVSLFGNVLGGDILNIASMAAMIILIKPIVLCPAIMIVKNCMVFDSLALLKNYLLMKSDWLLKLIVAGLGAGLLLSIILANLKIEGTGKTISDAANHIVSGLIGLTISIGGVIYVALLEPPVEETETAETKGSRL